jgi:hypothetical protein
MSCRIADRLVVRTARSSGNPWPAWKRVGDVEFVVTGERQRLETAHNRTVESAACAHGREDEQRGEYSSNGC